jgi:hypothetical protein
VWRRKAGCELKGMEDLLCVVDGRYDQEAKRVLWLGLMCSKMQPAVRYSMRQVCQYPDSKFDVQEEPMDIFTDTIQSTSCTTMSTRSQQDGSCTTMSTRSQQDGQ